MPTREKTRFVAVWWMSGYPYGLEHDNRQVVEAFVDARNALVVEIRSDGYIAHVADWYWRDDTGRPMEAIWHEQQPPARWSRKYLVIWWKKMEPADEVGRPHAMVFYNRSEARKLARQSRGFLVEVIRHGGKVGDTEDYKFFDKDGKPGPLQWKNREEYGQVPPFVRGPIVLAGGRWPRA